MLEPLEEEEAIRKSGQGIVERAGMESLGGVLQLRTSLSIGQIRRGYVGEGLCHLHIPGTEGAGGIAIQIERAEAPIHIAQRKREYGPESRLDRPWPELL